MKKNVFIIAACSIYLCGYLVYGCKKDNNGQEPNPGIASSFTEEFINMYEVINNKGWVSSTAIENGLLWDQGVTDAVDKGGIPYGFPAYSKTNSADEYAGIFRYDASANPINSWLITPVLHLKNGDKISFYTRADMNSSTDRMMVTINSSATKDIGNNTVSVGGFTTTVLDINPLNAAIGYPQSWQKYEFTISGFPERKNVRIGFRYFSPGGSFARGIGIDQFKYETN